VSVRTGSSLDEREEPGSHPWIPIYSSDSYTYHAGTSVTQSIAWISWPNFTLDIQLYSDNEMDMIYDL
jgi:hypothetical protein